MLHIAIRGFFSDILKYVDRHGTFRQARAGCGFFACIIIISCFIRVVSVLSFSAENQKCTLRPEILVNTLFSCFFLQRSVMVIVLKITLLTLSCKVNCGINTVLWNSVSRYAFSIHWNLLSVGFLSSVVMFVILRWCGLMFFFYLCDVVILSVSQVKALNKAPFDDPSSPRFWCTTPKTRTKTLLIKLLSTWWDVLLHIGAKLLLAV